MENIVLESEVYNTLVRKIDCIMEYIKENDRQNIVSGTNPTEIWISDDDAAAILRVSRRTMQRLRSNRKITYSIRGGKVWYTLAEVKRLLSGHVVNSINDSEGGKK